jgi:hypothetical protein
MAVTISVPEALTPGTSSATFADMFPELTSAG